jgi:hypothetical protein
MGSTSLFEKDAGAAELLTGLEERICGVYIDVISIRSAYNIKKRIDLTGICGRGSNS